MAEYLSLALSSFLSIDVFLGLLVGVVGGMIIGIIPGLGPSVGIALLLPISFSMSPTAALVMMTAMYTTGVYGGSITAVLCHTPGTAASAATTLDGYEMTKKGRGHGGRVRRNHRIRCRWYHWCHLPDLICPGTRKNQSDVLLP